MVAETLNFTRAAERLNLTQSAVSHQIKSLEQELGEPLFIRAKRGVKLSQSGQAVLERAIRIVDEVQSLKERVLGRENQPVGRVRAAAATQAFVHLFAPLFESFMRAHAGIDLTFRSTVSTDQTVADILNGLADVGFASLPVYSPTLKVTDLFEDELVLVVGHGHRLAGRESATLQEIRGERLILFERGVGISLLPAWTVRDEVAWGWLAKLKIEGHRLRRQVAVISLGRFQPSATRAFLDFMLERKGELQAMAEGEAPSRR